MGERKGKALYKYIDFAVFGKVRGQSRPRFTSVTRLNKKKRAYETPEDTAYKKAIAKAYMQAANGTFFTGEVALYIGVFRIMPKSKKGDCEPDIYKPDSDNIAKAVMDALNGVAYEDDRQVTLLQVDKEQRIKRRETEYLDIRIESLDYD